jgi:hypothetical protein
MHRKLIARKPTRSATCSFPFVYAKGQGIEIMAIPIERGLSRYIKLNLLDQMRAPLSDPKGENLEHGESIKKNKPQKAHLHRSRLISRRKILETIPKRLLAASHISAHRRNHRAIIAD